MQAKLSRTLSRAIKKHAEKKTWKNKLMLSPITRLVSPWLWKHRHPRRLHAVLRWQSTWTMCVECLKHKRVSAQRLWPVSPLFLHLESWVACSQSRWVLRTTEKVYRLDFNIAPPYYTGIIYSHASVKATNFSPGGTLHSEKKGAIGVVPNKKGHSCFYSSTSWWGSSSPPPQWSRAFGWPHTTTTG